MTRARLVTIILLAILAWIFTITTPTCQAHGVYTDPNTGAPMDCK